MIGFPDISGSVPAQLLRAVSGHGGIASDYSLVFIMPVAMCFLLRNGALVHVVALLTDRSGGRPQAGVGGTCGRSWPLGRLLLW